MAKNKTGMLKAREAAQILGITESALHYQREHKIGPPFHKRNGRFYYKEEELIAFLNTQTDGIKERLAQVKEQKT